MFVTAAIDLTAVLPFAIFGLFAAAAWWFLGFVAKGSTRAEERLEELSDPTARRRGAEGGPVKKTEVMTEALKKAAATLEKPLKPKTALEANKLKARLSYGGFRSDAAPSIFLGLKLIFLIFGVLIGGGTALALSGLDKTALFRTVSVAGVMFYLPELALWFVARKRKEAIFLGLPDALDLMVVCVEAGLALDQAMRKVSDEMQNLYGVIAGEFALCNFQLQMGRSRVEVLQELGSRTGVDDLRSLTAILIQADRFGSSIAQALRVQSDSMRVRRTQLAEEKAAKTAVKLIFPLVLFIFPGIFVVLVGPAAITMMRDMLPMMGAS